MESGLSQNSSEAENQIAGLYIHVPFCQTKCPYCDFYSITDQSACSTWLDSAVREFSFYQDKFSDFDTVYIGGGTPSLLAVEQLARLLDAAHKIFNIAPAAQVTIEANPDDLSLEKLDAYKTLGINRLSLGVQSFDDEQLKFLNRRHDSAKSIDAITQARQAGFDNISLDLIYGLPDQSTESWQQTLEKAIAFQPEHLSCYGLTLEENTPFGAALENGEITPCSEQKMHDLFLYTSQTLNDAGFLHYEVSNFAKSQALTSAHNRKYWNHTPYLGIGPSAHSFLDSRRWWNHRSVQTYCESIEKQNPPISDSETLTSDQIKMEKIYLSLRTMYGLDISVVKENPNLDRTLSQLQEQGLANITGTKIIPTSKGMLLADSLALAFD